MLTTDVRAYAALSARLAEPDADRAALLAEHGLDEDGWDELDDVWQAGSERPRTRWATSRAYRCS